MKRDRGQFARASWIIIGPPCADHGEHFVVTLVVDKPGMRLAREMMLRGTTPEAVVVEVCQERLDTKRAFGLDLNNLWRGLS